MTNPASDPDAVDDAIERLTRECGQQWERELLVFTRYWDAPTRTRATDLAWIARQCHKELCDGVLLQLESFAASLDSWPSTRDLGRHLRVAAEEFPHFEAYADAHALIRSADDDELTIRAARQGWPQNDALQATRRRHRREFGELGVAACVITEGGGLTLYRSGMELAHRPGGDQPGGARRAADVAIAAASTAVYDDEVGHAASGFALLREVRPSVEDVELVGRLTSEQNRLRVHMRNAQFGFLLTADEVEIEIA